MRYYSEETVRNIIKGVAHTALEQSENYADAILQNHQSIEISEPHGDLIDRNQLKDKIEYNHDEYTGWDYPIIDWDDIENAPIVLEATKEKKK